MIDRLKRLAEVRSQHARNSRIRGCPGDKLEGFAALALIAAEAIRRTEIGESFDRRVFIVVSVAELKKTAQP
jgi:hypothetical protein